MEECSNARPDPKSTTKSTKSTVTWITLADGPHDQGGIYADEAVLAHEMGHGFGLLHSSGPYGKTYDSYWDVMSSPSGNCPFVSPPHPQYGCVGVHTISYHKDFLGWIPSAQKYVATPGSNQTIVLERLGQPVSSSNYLMAQIPIGGSTIRFYTVEARRFAGYDSQIPGEAVVIHQVDTTRSDRLAQVVDVDNNGDPNDAGAMWTPGETFTDLANGITVSVNAASTAGFEVTIYNSTFSGWTPLPGGTLAGPAVVIFNNNPWVFVRGTDDRIYPESPDDRRLEWLE